MSGADWTFSAVIPDLWPDMAALFEGRGGPKECWCMMWRQTLAGKSAPPAAADRRDAIGSLALAGRQIGLVGYDGTTPVAWVSIAPRAAFGSGLGPGDDPGLWSVTCFFIRASHRKQLGFAALLAAAEGHAKAQGGTAIEAYPVDPDSPSYRFSGFVPSFEQAGYVETGHIGQRRHIHQKAL